MGLPILLVGRGRRSRPGAAAALGAQLPTDLAGHGSAAQKALDPGPDQGAGFIGGGAVGKCWHTAVSARLAHRTVPIQRPLSGADAAKWRCETRIRPPFRDPLAAAHAKTVTAAFDSREGCTDRTKPGPPPNGPTPATPHPPHAQPQVQPGPWIGAGRGSVPISWSHPPQPGQPRRKPALAVAPPRHGSPCLDRRMPGQRPVTSWRKTGIDTYQTAKDRALRLGRKAAIVGWNDSTKRGREPPWQKT